MQPPWINPPTSRYLLLCLFVGSLLSHQCNAADEKTNTINVDIRVTGENGLGEQITSYVNRGLQSIHDVRIVPSPELEKFKKEDMPDATISIMSVPIAMGSRGDGYAISVAISYHYDGSIMQELGNKKISMQSIGPIFDSWMRGALWSIQVLTVPTDGLEQFGKDITAQLDGGCLEFCRKSKALISSTQSKTSEQSSSPERK